jgi:peroxiredoxin
MQRQKLKVTIIRVLCSLFFLVGCSRQENVLHDNQNHTTPLSALKGKWVVINYWADWCDNCVTEMPELNSFYHANPNVLMYSVSYDHLTGNDLSESVRKMKIDFPVLLDDPMTLLHLTMSDYLPMTFIINPEGHVVKRLIGTNTKRSLTEALHQLQKTHA